MSPIVTEMAMTTIVSRVVSSRVGQTTLRSSLRVSRNVRAIAFSCCSRSFSLATAITFPQYSALGGRRAARAARQPGRALVENLGDDAGADGAAALADGEAQ